MSNTVGYSLGGCVTAARYNLTQGEDATGNVVGYALPVPTCGVPIVIPEIVWSNRWAERTFTLYGFYENQGYISSPPKKYLRCESEGEIFYYSNGGGPVNPISCTGATTYDPLTGARLTQQSAVLNGSFWQYVDRAWYMNQGGDSQYDPAFIEDATTIYWTLRPGLSASNTPQGTAVPKPCDASLDTGITEWQYLAWHYNTYNSRLVETLSEENTEDSCVAANWGLLTWSAYSSTPFEAKAQLRTAGSEFYRRVIEAQIVTPVIGMSGTPLHSFTVTVELEGRAYGSTGAWSAASPHVIIASSDSNGRLNIVDAAIPCPAGQERRISDVVVTA